ncbi:MAG: hypothetical protein AB1646_24135 [Thermodesulfobacteriota bacterium]
MIGEEPEVERLVEAPGHLVRNKLVSPLGLKLRAIRERFVAQGGRLLTREELSEEIAERRGGTAGFTHEKEDVR